MNSTDSTKDTIFHLVQEFLRDPPVIIWGSGGTIPYGLPSMNELREKLTDELREVEESTNLETDLGNIEDSDKLDRVKKIIRDEVLKRDILCLTASIQDPNYLEAIVKMANKFYNVHPRKIDIVTTNYDRVLEYAISQAGFNYTDGFTGKALSRFNRDAFGHKKIINLIKVHGSLDWAVYGNDTFALPCECEIDELEHAMILPSKKKYEDSYKEPYRTLITKSDEAIEAAQSFLVVGFGFNDEHLTPKIKSKIRAGTPIVIITKEATDSCMNKLNSAVKYCLFKESNNGTKAMFKKKSSEPEKIQCLEGSCWKLNNFMEII